MTILPGTECGSYDGEVRHLLSMLDSIHARLEQIMIEVGHPEFVLVDKQREKDLKREAYRALGYPGKA